MSGLADADVEGLARAVGVLGLDPRRTSVSHSDGHGRCIQPMGGACVGADTPAIALLLLGHARGLRLDLGECPACRGSGFERALHRSREAEAEARKSGWWCRGGDFETGESEWFRPCHACTVDGTPTGRESIDWATALARAMPRPCATCELWGDIRESTCPECEGTSKGDRPADPDTREALGVLADQMQASPDPCGFCKGRKWATSVDAWGPGVTVEQANPRRVKCTVCDGTGVDEHGDAKVELVVWFTAWLLDDGGRALASYLGDIGAAVRAETDRLYIEHGTMPAQAVRDIRAGQLVDADRDVRPSPR